MQYDMVKGIFKLVTRVKFQVKLKGLALSSYCMRLFCFTLYCTFGQLIYRCSVPETYLSFNSPIYEQTKSNSTKCQNN